ncbi:MAG: tetraacyldisaccharide 4'-kinase [Gammaproteobacteria bacterium]|nr:tetraacyldisaccharide 4'-kinase [Gammaproteobacteria bacterium]
MWYGGSPLAALLLPAAWLHQLAVTLRAQAYATGLLPTARLPVPVIVVGNLSVGGTGKTPLVIWLSQFLRGHGYSPGVVSRGYGGSARNWPQQVRPDSDPYSVGDEPVLLARRTACPVAAGPDRVEAAAALIEHCDCDIIIADDGLQHYALGRDVEIAVIDGVRRFGNGQLLPAGPLRESPARLDKTDLVVANGLAGRGEFAMKYVAGALCSLDDPWRQVELRNLQTREVHAVAGIGNPENFFAMLRAHGLRVHVHAFPDHHRFRAADVQFDDDRPVIMTEKDAVKCHRFATPAHWYLPVSASLPQVFEHRLLSLLEKIDHGQASA